MARSKKKITIKARPQLPSRVINQKNCSPLVVPSASPKNNRVLQIKSPPVGGGDKHELTRESLKTMNTMGQPLGNFLAKLLGEAKLTFVLHLLEKRINPILL